MKLTEIRPIAEGLVALLRPACERIAIAGSIRREEPECGDIEIVAIAKFDEGVMFAVESMVDVAVRAMCGNVQPPHYWFEHPVLEYQLNANGNPRANGDKYKALRHRETGLNIDLFICHADNWGNTMVIRTGPAAFSSWLVSPRSKGGCMPFGLRQQDGLLQDLPNQRVIPCPEEEDYFAALGMEWIEPRDRRAPDGWR